MHAMRLVERTLPERVDQLRALVILKVPPAASSAGTKVGITPKGLKRQPEGRECGHPVSYTHLTLPTIYSV